MSRLNDHFGALRAETEPTPDALARLRTRPAKPPRRRPAVVLLPTLAAAAAALLWLRPPDAVHTPNAPAPHKVAPPPGAPPQPVSASWSGASATTPLGPHVVATATGLGAVSGTTRDLTVDWTTGDISLEVEPNAGMAVQVKTEEAQVVVTGTVFSVRRDALGTRVEVGRGRVEVRCGEEPTVSLTAGTEQTCLPLTAVGWLRRAVALSQVRDAHGTLHATERGLALAPAPDIALELGLQQATALVAVARPNDARDRLAFLQSTFPEHATRVAQTRDRLGLEAVPPTAMEAP
jgi:hypothetical protein